MRSFEYVPKEEYGPARDNLTKLINDVQDLLRNQFTFSYQFIGSSRRNMITREIKGNQGFDFDVDLRVNDDEENYSPKELKNLLMAGINRVVLNYGYCYCEDSSSVITIKKIDCLNSRIDFSCDFAIVNDFEDKNGNPHQQYIYFDKNKNEYRWRERTKEYCGLRDKEEVIKKAGRWGIVRDLYLNKKCRFSYEKKSRTLYAETINEVFDWSSHQKQ